MFIKAIHPNGMMQKWVDNALIIKRKTNMLWKTPGWVSHSSTLLMKCLEKENWIKWTTRRWESIHCIDHTSAIYHKHDSKYNIINISYNGGKGMKLEIWVEYIAIDLNLHNVFLHFWIICNEKSFHKSHKLQRNLLSNKFWAKWWNFLASCTTCLHGHAKI
jgi:hypothetical protein